MADRRNVGGMEDQTITVVGFGRATRPPDVAEARLAVQLTRPTAAEARREAALAVDAVLAALGQAGVARDDVRTVRLALHPVYEHERGGGNRLTGHQLTNEMAVLVRDLDAVGRIVDAAISAGATTVESVSFRVADEAGLRREALSAAIADARGKAEVLAGAARVRLGPVRSLGEEVGRSGPPVPLAMRMEAAGETPVVPGDVEIVARVSTVFHIIGEAT